MAEETSPGVEDAPEVEEVIEETDAPEAEELEPELDEDGNPVEPEEPEDDTDEIEKDGTKYRIPKALKDNFLMHRDYTHKTQALAEKERQVDATLQHAEGLSNAEVFAAAKVVSINEAIATFASVDWDLWEEQDPPEAAKAWRRLERLKGDLQAAQNNYGFAKQQRISIAQQETARRIEQGTAELAKAIPGWGEDKAATLLSFAQKHYGFTEAELNEINDPRIVLALNDAFERVQEANKSKTVKKVQAQQAVQPARKVTGAAAPIRPLDDRASTEAWMKARQKQLSSR